MKTRTLLVFFHSTNFLVMFFATVFIFFSNVVDFESNKLILCGYYAITALGGVTLTFWILLAEKRLEKYSTKANVLEKRLIALEETIKLMKKL